MQSQGAIFFNSSVIGSTASNSVSWPGGRSALVFSATQYGTPVTPQMQTGNGRWIPICSSIVSDQIFAFDAPAGQYRVVSFGSSVGLAATISMIY